MLVIRGGKKNDIINSAGLELDYFALSAGYIQIIDKPSHAVNNLISCMDLIVCTNQNIISKHRLCVSIFDKYHHNIIYGKINICVSLQPIYVRKVWDSVRQMLKISKKQYLTFIEKKCLQISLYMEKLYF